MRGRSPFFRCDRTRRANSGNVAKLTAIRWATTRVRVRSFAANIGGLSDRGDLC
jgi:hypothetical protein